MSTAEPINPNTLSSNDINQLTEDEYNQLRNPSNSLFVLDSKGQRFDLHPAYRIPLIMAITGVIGGLNGLTEGYRKSALKYLASNSHRLPKTKNGWFYYHKRKNYVCMKGSFETAFKSGFRLSFIFGSVFTLEATLDYMRGCIDFANTAMSIGMLGWCYAVYHDFTRVQTKQLVRKGFGVGIVIGLIQDGLQLLKGDDVWYLRQFFGIYPRDVSHKKVAKF